MSKSLRVTLLAISGLVGLLVLVAVAVVLFVDANAYKSRLEAAASGALGMDVTVGGRLGIGFYPWLLITLQDVRIRNRGTDVASAQEARLGIGLMSLFQDQLKIRKITLNDARISVERDRDGRFNFERPEPTGEAFPALDPANISLSDGTLIYTDEETGEGFKAADCRMDVHRVQHLGGQNVNLMKGLSVTADVACGEFRKDAFVVFDLKLSANGENGVFVIKPVTMRIFGAQGSGSMQANFTGAVPRYDVHYSLPQFYIEEFFKTLSPKKVAEGQMDFSMNLTMRGDTLHEMRRTMEGQISLRGENLTLNDSDLDREFSRFESSQNFSLVDVGAFFFAGPVGLVVTKGYNFASVFQGSGGNSKIRTLVSDWKVERGVAQAQDVAMVTSKNRVALQGGLDFVEGQFDDVTVALIDQNGCVEVQQRVNGAFRHPVVEKPGIVKSLTGPALELLKKGRDLFPGAECEVFYAGSVVPPT